MVTAKERNEQFSELKTSLIHLISEYEEACNMINDQIQAVIQSDLAMLDSLVEEQLSKHESLQDLEDEFKKELKGVFEDYCLKENKYSLSLLMHRLEAPSKELNRLRNQLQEQVKQTQRLRNQLVELLQFASKHNMETFEGIFQLGNDGSESYGADGQKKQGTVGSVAINQKA